MRFKLLFAALALAIIVNLLADPSIGQSQQFGGKQTDPTGGTKGGKQKFPGAATDPNADPNAGGGFGGKGGKGGKGKGGIFGGMELSADQMFELYAGKGKDVIDLNNMRFTPPDLKIWIEQNKITDGKLTKDAFGKYFAARDDLKKQLQDSGKGAITDFFGKGKGKKGGDPADPNDPFAKGGKGKKGPKAYDDEWAEQQFKRYDLNSDSKLTEEEIAKVGDPFRQVWKKYDTDNNGYINLAEWKQYQKDRAAEREANWSAKGGPDKKGDTTGKFEIEEEERVIVVWRKNKLPPELPAWFKEIDKQPHDGQITLLEWRLFSKKPIEEFQAMDRNDDGILTIEEVLRYTQLARAGYLKKTSDDEGDDEDEDGVARPILLPGYPQGAIQRFEVVDPTPKSEFDKKGGKKGAKGGKKGAPGTGN